LASLCLEYLINECERDGANNAFIGQQNGRTIFHAMRDFDRMADFKRQRPREQWRLQLKEIASLMAKPTPEPGNGET
jgi:hypothetical protein